jgi:hypothetical protein
MTAQTKANLLAGLTTVACAIACVFGSQEVADTVSVLSDLVGKMADEVTEAE